LKESKKQEEAVLNTEKKYESVQQELEESRFIIKKLKSKLDVAQSEIKEL
jgi:hypothetical protein